VKTAAEFKQISFAEIGKNLHAVLTEMVKRDSSKTYMTYSFQGQRQKAKSFTANDTNHANNSFP